MKSPRRRSATDQMKAERFGAAAGAVLLRDRGAIVMECVEEGATAEARDAAEDD